MTLLFVASYSISLNVYVNSFCRNKNAKDAIALTFDDGVDEVITPKVLDILANHNAKATFFLIGENARQHPDLVRRIVNEGHEIGNHTMQHKGTFPMQSSVAMTNEIQECTELLESISGTKIKYFRPPFGVTNPNLAKALKNTSLQSIGWSVRSFDTMGHPVERVTNRILNKLKAGDIILLHDNRQGADLIVENLLVELANRSLHPVAISNLSNLNQ